MLQVSHMAKEAIAKREIEQLSKVIQFAEESNVVIRILVRVEELLKYLKEAKRVAALLTEALEKNQLEALQAALEQCHRMELTFTEEKTPELIALTTKVVAARDVIVRKNKARKRLDDAVISENLPELKGALVEAKEAGIEEEKLYGEALKLKDTLEYEVQVMDGLTAATQTGIVDCCC